MVSPLDHRFQRTEWKNESATCDSNENVVTKETSLIHEIDREGELFGLLHIEVVPIGFDWFDELESPLNRRLPLKYYKYDHMCSSFVIIIVIRRLVMFTRYGTGSREGIVIFLSFILVRRLKQKNRTYTCSNSTTSSLKTTSSVPKAMVFR